MEDEVTCAAEGTGPLLQRDYWAVLAECPMDAPAVMDHVKAHFTELPPSSLVEFTAPHGVACGTELDITLHPGPQCRVRVVHEDAHSITFGTLSGHPEAGRITFGAYRNDAGEVIFHIRSRARAATTSRLIGFLAIGEAMQTNTWTDFVNHTAASVGARIRDVIHAHTKRVDESAEDRTAEAPTFLAVER